MCHGDVRRVLRVPRCSGSDETRAHSLNTGETTEERGTSCFVLVSVEEPPKTDIDYYLKYWGKVMTLLLGKEELHFKRVDSENVLVYLLSL